MKEVKYVVPLKDVCLDFIVPQRDKPTAFDGSIPWCRIEDIEGRYLNGSKSGQNVTKELADQMNMHLCPKGTVISACSASIGNQAITTTDCYTNQTFIGLVVNPNLLYNVYLYYFLESQTKNLLKLGQGATIKYISKDKYKRMLIPLPPLSEQQSIVDYLDSAFAKIDALKANAQKQLDEAKALFQASLKEMLEPKEGWEEKTLKDMGQTQTGTTPSKFDKLNYGDYIEFIRPSEIDCDGNGRINYNCEIKLSEQGASKGRVFASNSILMVCIGATIGKVGFSTKEVSCNQQINVFTPKDDLNYKFVYYAMRSPSFQHRVIKEGTSSQATLPIINKGKWEQLSISFPKIKEQEVIASHLDNLSSKVSDLKENFDKISQECDALKQAILREIFE